MAPAVLRSLTLERIFRTRCSGSIIVGVTSSATPNGLNSIVGVVTPLAVVEATGTGNSPPARKGGGGRGRRGAAPRRQRAVVRLFVFGVGGGLGPGGCNQQVLLRECVEHRE